MRLEDQGLKKGLVAALLLLCLALTACGAKPGGGAKVLLDGAEWDKSPLSPEVASPRVYITLDGEALIALLRGEHRWQLFVNLSYRVDESRVAAYMQDLADRAPEGVRAELEVNPVNMV